MRIPLAKNGPVAQTTMRSLLKECCLGGHGAMAASLARSRRR